MIFQTVDCHQIWSTKVAPQSRVADLRSQTAGVHIAALVKFLELRKGILSVELYGMLLRLSIW